MHPVTRMIPAHPLVRAEWQHIVEVPAYDYQIATEEFHLGIYVRRVSGVGWHELVGLINHVVVARESRGHGIGSAIVTESLAWLQRNHVPLVHVHCDSITSDFYKRFGFVVASGWPAPDHHGPRISMVAKLNRTAWLGDPVEYVEPW